jgi:ApeA N-terminal domain 1
VAEKEEQKQHLAHFTVRGTDHAGALNLDGPNTKLDIFSDDVLHLKDEEMACVRGVSKEGISISAIYCVPLVMPGSASYHDKHKHFITLRPNYVVLGPDHLEPAADVIKSISFTFSEANNLFYDWGTFGNIIWKHRLSFGQMREILRGVRNRPKHRRRGGDLGLYYRWDRGPILEAECDIGKITIWNATQGKMPSPSGLDVRNRVRVTCDFLTPLNLNETLRVRHQLMVLFELAAQGRQNVDYITLQHKNMPEGSPLAFHASSEERKKVDALMPTDALVNGGLHEDEFSRVLVTWMNSALERSAARRRFIDGFRRGRSFDTDRLVGAANAFDLLPAADFIKQGALPSEVETLLAGIERQVKEAAKSSAIVNDYKERLLNNLGLVRGLNLRNKVVQQWSTVPDCIASRLPAMPDAIAHSVRARNFFVHGSTVNMSTEDMFTLAPFFTDTLEFVFGVSELCRCGWDPKRWAKEGYSLSHYKWYISNFSEYMKRVDAAVHNGKTDR